MTYIKKLIFVILFTIITSQIGAMVQPPAPVYRIVRNPVTQSFKYTPEKSYGKIQVRAYWSNGTKHYSSMIPLQVLENIVTGGYSLLHKGKAFSDLVFEPQVADVEDFHEAVQAALDVVPLMPQ